MVLTVSESVFPVAVSKVFSMMSTLGDGSLADMTRIADRRDTVAIGLSSSCSGLTQEMRISISEEDQGYEEV